MLTLAAPSGCGALELTLQVSPWTDSFRGATRAVTISADDSSTGQRVGSLGLEELPLPTGGVTEARPLLSGLIVQPTHRRRGVARRLVDAAEAQARAWGYTELMLYVAADNRAAVQLYDAIGFVDAADGTRCEVAPEAADADAPFSFLTSWLRRAGGARILFLRKACD